MMIRDRIAAAARAGAAEAAAHRDPRRYTSHTDDQVAARVTAWQGRLADAMRAAVRQGTDRSLARVQATALEVEMARRAAQVRFGR